MSVPKILMSVPVVTPTYNTSKTHEKMWRIFLDPVENVY